jgi:hypothetical protein
MWVFDVTDFNNVQTLSAFDVSEMDSPWSRAAGLFGAHQFREKMDSTHVYLTWFSEVYGSSILPTPLSRRKSPISSPNPSMEIPVRKAMTSMLMATG